MWPLSNQSHPASQSPSTPSVSTRRQSNIFPTPRTATTTTPSPVKSFRKAVPTFTSSLQFPKELPQGTLPSSSGASGESKRRQRKSKIDAITRLDKSSTPTQNIFEQSETVFWPDGVANLPPLPSAPHPLRNPLNRPKVINPSFSTDNVRTKAPRCPAPRREPRLFGLEECPTFYPTVEQFQDPMAYIDSIAEEGKVYGICKIVPPEGWQMPFALATKTFRFKSRLQRLNQLEAASRAKLNFLEQLSMFHMQQGDAKAHIPLIDRQPLDVWKLRREVNKSGGYLELDRVKGWPKITELLDHKPSWTPHIRAAYMNIILPFDKWAVRAKASSVAGSPVKPATMVQSSHREPRATSLTSRLQDLWSLTSEGSLTPKTEEDLNVLNPKTNTTSCAMEINVPGFSEKDGDESELSEEESPKKKLLTRRSLMKQEYQKGEVCEICGDGHSAEKILLCDGCDRGFHIYCLDPPLAVVPIHEEWFCTSCLLSQGEDFGFEEGEEHCIPSFHARDTTFSQAWWYSHQPHSTQHIQLLPADDVMVSEGTEEIASRQLGGKSVTEDDVEREFWRLTDSSLDTVDVEYGADIHSTTHGSAAPTLEVQPLNPYSADPWNLNNMPILPASLLRYIKQDISGMTVPWIYIGMMFSTFCWHNEDHYTYSINYMYWGETKTWYGVPGSDAGNFEAAIKSEAPDLFEQQPGLLFQLVTMMNPGRLKEAGVKVVACDQRPNEFVITFPKAYHCGFNHGINLNEAVNFALPDWLPDGKECVLRYQEYQKAPVFSHDELILTTAIYSETIRTALWLKDAFARMVTDELAFRNTIRADYIQMNEDLIEEDCPEDQYQCSICKSFCYLAQCTCPCTTSVACLNHVEELCSCELSVKTMRKRFDDGQLKNMLEVLEQRALIPNQWRFKFAKVLENARPQLKSLRTILAEGEKIGYPLSELKALKHFVDRASSLMDAVTAIGARKNTGKRKQNAKQDSDRTNKRARTELDDGMDSIDRGPEHFINLLQQIDRLAFDAPELPQLRQLKLTIISFREEAKSLLATPEEELDRQKCKTTFILGQSLGLDFPELAPLERIVQRQDWIRKVEEEVDDRRLEYEDIIALLEESVNCGILQEHILVKELKKRQTKAKEWMRAAEILLASQCIEIQDISALVEQEEHVPVSINVLRKLEAIRKSAISWQTSATNILTTKGSTAAATRLCKAVAAASAPLNHVRIPEISQLQQELDYHSQWNEAASKMLGVSGPDLSNTIEYIRAEFENNLAPDDDEPNSRKVCFCRSPVGSTTITCKNCGYEYHPKCVDVSPRNLLVEFKCAMCQRLPNDDGPSLHAFIELILPERWNFVITPVEFEVAQSIAIIAVRYAPKLIHLTDPLDQAMPIMDLKSIRHAIRKIYTLPLVFDVHNSETNERCVLTNWLFRRMQDAIRAKTRQNILIKTASLAPADVDSLAAKDHTTQTTFIEGQVRNSITRRRKARLLLAESHPHSFHCICKVPPPETLLNDTTECPKCKQVYHRQCVKASTEFKGTIWRCPCCAVKEGKHYQKDVEVRVQMSALLGSDQYVDYRATINGFAESPVLITLPPSNDVVLLECIRFTPAFVPNIPQGLPNEELSVKRDTPAETLHSAATVDHDSHSANGDSNMLVEKVQSSSTAHHSPLRIQAC
ncbi:hypothetical protein L204_105797 [Cryptococcus depauperatus]|nr:hypothetical protein L204_06061 [Cryptococcus depauperatus CBS 7855]